MADAVVAVVAVAVVGVVRFGLPSDLRRLELGWLREGVRGWNSPGTEIWRPGVKMQGDHQTQPFIIAAVRIDEMLGTDVLGYLGPERAVWQPRTRRRCRSP